MPARISHVARSRAVASVRLLVCFASRYFTLMSCRKEHTAPRQWQLHRYAFLLRAIPCEQGRQFLFRAPRSSDSAILDGGVPDVGAGVWLRRTGPIRWWAGPPSSQRMSSAMPPCAGVSRRCGAAKIGFEFLRNDMLRTLT